MAVRDGIKKRAAHMKLRVQWMNITKRCSATDIKYIKRCAKLLGSSSESQLSKKYVSKVVPRFDSESDYEDLARNINMARQLLQTAEELLAQVRTVPNVGEDEEEPEQCAAAQEQSATASEGLEMNAATDLPLKLPDQEDQERGDHEEGPVLEFWPQQPDQEDQERGDHEEGPGHEFRPQQPVEVFLQQPDWPQQPAPEQNNERDSLVCDIPAQFVRIPARAGVRRGSIGTGIQAGSVFKIGKQKYARFPRLEMKKSAIDKAGLGIFAQESIKKNEIVTQYAGKVISRAEAEELTARNKHLWCKAFSHGYPWVLNGQPVSTEVGPFEFTLEGYCCLHSAGSMVNEARNSGMTANCW
jgi:hypothetical protein